MIIEFKGKKPQIEADVFIGENVTIIGDVKIGSGSSIWPGAVLRGDLNSITIGKNSNIQDCTVIHVDSNVPTVIGDNVTVGHSAVIHGCVVGNQSLIGMGATVLDGAVVGEKAIVAANALVTPGKKVDDMSLWGGVPAKKLRTITEQEADKLLESANRYTALAKEYMG